MPPGWTFCKSFVRILLMSALNAARKMLIELHRLSKWFWRGYVVKADVNLGQLSSIAEITDWAISSTPLSSTRW